MKISCYVFLVLSLLALVSCEIEEYIYTYNIKNSTENDIEMIFYSASYKNDTVNVAANDMELWHVESYADLQTDTMGWMLVYDSIMIKRDEIILKLISSKKERGNIYDRSMWEEKQVDDTEFVHIYEINESTF